MAELPTNLPESTGEESGVSGEEPLGRDNAAASAAAVARFILLLLALAWLLIDLVLWVQVTSAPRPPHLVETRTSLAHSMILAQAMIMAALVTWLRINLAVRLFAAGVWLAGLSQLGRALNHDVSAAQWFGMVILHFLMPLSGMQLANACGVHLTAQGRLADQLPFGRAPHAGGPSQFSLSDLLTVTTAAALILVAWRLADFPPLTFSAFTIYLALSGPSVFTGWIILFPRNRSWQQLCTGCLGNMFLLSVVFLVWLCTPRRQSTELLFYMLTFATAIAFGVGVTALVSRIAGLRLVRVPRDAASS